MIILLTFLALSALSLLIFVGLDAYAAFDKDPDTHTVSEYVKKWAKQSNAHRVVVSFGIMQLVFVAIYLFLHWVLQLI